MEDKSKNTSTVNKSSSPSKVIANFSKTGTNISLPVNMTENYANKNKTYFLNKGEITKNYIDEDDLEGINISYKEPEKKLKLISLDLLLKKIVLENFIDKNLFYIFSFSQQCYCFINKDIMFNKIIDCYNFFKNKKTPISQIKNLIIFLNILIIEMYEYYTSIKTDEPCLLLLKNFYNSVICELIELLNQEVEEKESNDNALNIDKEANNNINSINEGNENLNENKQETNYKEDRCSGLLDNLNISKTQNEDITNNRDRTTTYNNVNDYQNSNNNLKDRNSYYLENEKRETKKANKLQRNVALTRNTVNCVMEQLEDDKKLDKKKRKEQNKKKGFGNFFHIKKDKPVKVEDKNENQNNKNILEIKRKTEELALKRAHKVNQKSSPEEELLNSIKNIIVLFSIETPITRDLRLAKNSIDFYKDLKTKLLNTNNDKQNSELKHKRSLVKSVTVGTISNKQKLKLHENDGYFDVLDWDQKEIGEKLLMISKSLVGKVERREIYRAIYLKKNKETTSPNVMENIDKFNRLTFFIIQDILSYDFAKERAKVIEKWIKIADYCKTRKDYNDCVAINSALNNYIITGLKKTLKEIKSEKQEKLKEISKFCRVQGNYKKLREDMKNLQLTDFYVPYLGIILKDLAFYEENSKYIENNILINFEKLEKVQLAIQEFFRFKTIVDKNSFYPPQELDFFENLESLKEADLENLANNLEPEFKLYENKQKTKRLTEIDKKYFEDSNVKRPNMRNSVRFMKKMGK